MPNTLHILIRTALHVALLLLAVSAMHAQGPVASWPFNGNANDASGNGHNGTVVNATLVHDRFGNANSAYNFNGTSSSITVAGHSDFRFGLTQEYTVTAWVKVCSLQTTIVRGTFDYCFPFVVGTGVMQGSTSQGWGLGLALQNRPWWVTQVPVTGNHALNDDRVSVIDGGWHHLACVFGSNTTRLYLDGALRNSHNGLTADRTGNTTPLTIGRGQTYNTHFNGAIDDVAIYHRALSDSEIQALYSAGGWPSAGTGTVGITASQTRVCAGTQVQLTANATGPTAQYRWTPAEGLSDPTSRTPTVRPRTTTTYTVETWSSEPCAARLATASVTIEVDPAPRTGINGQTRYVCAGETVTIGAPAQEGLAPYRYSWSPAAGLSSPTSFETSLVATRSERYILEITDARGCVGRDTVMVSALPPPVPDAGADTLYCGGAAITLGRVDSLNGGTPPRRYRWSPAAGLDDSTLAQPTARPSKTTQYILEITDALGCKGLDTVVVRVGEPARALVGRDTSICKGGSATLGAASIDGYIYAWSPSTGLNNPRIANPIARPDTTTTYRLLARTSAGCEAVDSVTVTVLDPVLTVSVSELDFGVLDGCTPSKELTVRVSNDGTSVLRIASATFGTQEFVAVTAVPFDVAPGASRDVVIRYAPRGAGSVLDTLVIAGLPCGQVERIVLRGARERSLVSASAGALEFGRHLACALPDTTMTLTVRNDGDAPASLAAPIVAAPYTVEPAGALPAELVGGGTVTVTVRYRPTSAGTHADELRLPFTSGSCRDTLRVRLSGAVDEVALTALDAVDLGLLDGCATVRDTTLVIGNSGSSELRIVTASAPNGYRVLTPTPITITAGDSATVALRYEPAANGAHTGDLVLSAEPCALEHRVALSGTKDGVVFSLADSVDFGAVVGCDAVSMTRTVTLGASGASGTVSSVAISGPFTTTLAQGATVADGGTTSFEVSVLAGADRVITGTMTITLEPCGTVRTIALRATRTTMSLAAIDEDFGTQATGSLVTRDVVIGNDGTSLVRIDSLSGVDAPFSVVTTTPSLPVTLAPGETLTVRIEYRAATGTSVDTLVAYAGSPCTTTLAVELRGVGAITAASRIALPSITAAAGDRVLLPLLLDSARGLDAAGAHAFEATIAFDRTLLVPATPGSATSDATTRRMAVRGVRGAGDTLAVLPMIATLGSATSTPLVIESFRWTDASAPVAVTTSDGLFTLDGICESGGVRLFDASGEVTLKPAAPNPASGVAAIEYSLAERGRTTLALHDASGARVATLVDGDEEPGTYVQWVDVTAMPAGAYVIVLTTPTLVLSERMVVRR